MKAKRLSALLLGASAAAAFTNPSTRRLHQHQRHGTPLLLSLRGAAFDIMEDDPWIQQNLRQISRMRIEDIERELRSYNVMHCSNVSLKEEMVYQLLRARIQYSSRQGGGGGGGPPYVREQQQQRQHPEYYQQLYDEPTPYRRTRTRTGTSTADYNMHYYHQEEEEPSSLYFEPEQEQHHHYNNGRSRNGYQKAPTMNYYPSEYSDHHAPTARSFVLDPVITAPLFFASADRPVPVLVLDVHNEMGDRYAMALLVDTSSSGSCLRPSAARRLTNDNLPLVALPGDGATASASTTSTSTAPPPPPLGTGTAVATGSVRIHRLSVGHTLVTLEPFDVAIENIGANAWPNTVDGIVGMNFLQQFEALELDFANGVAHLYTDQRRAPQRLDDDRITVGKLTRLGVRPEPTLDLATLGVRVDGRGPVNMLFSTATTDSLLTWKGADALGLSRHSNEMTEIANGGGDPNATATGNVATHFTHRVKIFDRVELGGNKQLYAGSAVADSLISSPATSASAIQGRRMGGGSGGIDCRGMLVDVGSFPIITGQSQLRSAFERKNVGGILGMDILSRCSVLRISCGKGEVSMYRYPLPPQLLLKDDGAPLKNAADDDGYSSG